MGLATVGWGLLGTATTMAARVAIRRAMHTPAGAPRLPAAARTNDGIAMMLILAAAAGAMLALADVLQEQRKQHSTRARPAAPRRELAARV